MATRLRPLGLLAKWVVAPVGLCLIGYYIVGPRIGSRVPEHIKQMAGDQFAMLHTQVQKIVMPAVHPESAKQKVDVPAVTPPPAQDVPSTPPQIDAGGPQVEVSVRSANSKRNSGQNGASLKPKRHRRHKPKSKPKPKPESTDEGSYGGTQDQGTTTGGGGAADPPTGG